MTSSMTMFTFLALVAAAMIPVAARADETVSPKVQAPHAVTPKGNTDGKMPSAAARTADKVHRSRASNGSAGKYESDRFQYTFRPIERPGATKKNKTTIDDWNVTK
jgi:hypothetical protein